MSWDAAGAIYPAQTGEVNDADYLAFSTQFGTLNVSISTFDSENYVDLDLDTNTNAGCVPIGILNTGVRAIFTFKAGYSAAGSQKQALLWASNSGTGPPITGGVKYFGLDTAGKIEAYDKAGNLLRVFATGFSASTGQVIQILVDPLSLPSVWIAICVNGVWTESHDTALTPANYMDNSVMFLGEVLGASNPGNHLYVKHTNGETSSTAGDAPHLAAYQDLRVAAGQNPTAGAVGTGNWPAGNWDEGSAGVAASYLEVDNSELPTHDSPTAGSGTYLKATPINEKFYVTSGDANPVPSGKTIRRVQRRAVVTATGAGKGNIRFMSRLGASETNTAAAQTPGLTPQGNFATSIARPGGGSWVDTDFAVSNFEAGFATPAASAGHEVTFMTIAEPIYVNADLPLAPNPTSKTWYAMLGKGKVPQPANVSRFPFPRPFMGLYTPVVVVPPGTRRRMAWVA